MGSIEHENLINDNICVYVVCVHVFTDSREYLCYFYILAHDIAVFINEQPSQYAGFCVCACVGGWVDGAKIDLRLDLDRHDLVTERPNCLHCLHLR